MYNKSNTEGQGQGHNTEDRTRWNKWWKWDDKRQTNTGMNRMRVNSEWTRDKQINRRRQREEHNRRNNVARNERIE